MHDPLTVAFEIKYPWREKPSQLSPKGYRQTFITIWHKDPEKNGSDDSCDWFGSRRKLNASEKELLASIYDMEPILNNPPFYPEHEAHIRFKKVDEAKWKWLKRSKFRWHPRWHIWHWRIQIIPLQMLWRWLFEKCCYCKKGYVWREEIMGNWSGTASWHFGCDHHGSKPLGKHDSPIRNPK